MKAGTALIRPLFILIRGGKLSVATSLARAKVPTYSFRNLLGHERKQEDNVLISEGILKNNAIGILGGPPKSYKSFITQSLAVDLAIGSSSLFLASRKNHGRDQIAFSITRPLRILVLEQEVGEDDLEDRLKPLYESLPDDHKDLMCNNLFTHSLDHDLQLDKKEGMQAMESIVGEVKPDVLILDPLIEFHTSNENDTQSMSTVLRNLDLLREKFNPLAVWINHHEGKEGAVPREGADRLRGNSVIYGKGDTFLMLRVANPNAMIVNCSFTLRRGKRIKPFAVKIDSTSLRTFFHKWGSEKIANGEVADIIEDRKGAVQ